MSDAARSPTPLTTVSQLQLRMFQFLTRVVLTIPVQVSVTCTVTNPSNLVFPTATFTGTATTNNSGVFVAPLTGGSYPIAVVAVGVGFTAEQALNAYLFKDGLLGSGLLPGTAT